MNNNQINKYSFVMAVVCNAFLAFVFWNYAPEVFAQGQEPEPTVISFRLNGSSNYEEDDVSDVAAGLGFNITKYDVLLNNTILVEAVRQ